MKRRALLKGVSVIPFLAICLSKGFASSAFGAANRDGATLSRMRPGDPGWPSEDSWERLKENVGGRLVKLQSPFSSCRASPASAQCNEAQTLLKNTFVLGDEPSLTQTSGWVDAWTSQPSSYAVAAKTTGDVVAAVNFARKHNLRLVIKGGGHSYQGTSSSPDSLLVWTRHMNDVTLHNGFVAQGCPATTAAQPAVTLGAGAMWIDAYHAVTTKGGRYVQGGGCTTVGVAGLIQSGGFGNFSKKYGTAAAGLLEAEVVTANGEVRIANATVNPDLFWALKGGGGGSFGVVTRLTLRTRQLPKSFGAVFGTIKASSDASYRLLVAKVIETYQSALFNAHWGETINFNTGNSVDISLVFQGLTQQQAEELWAPFTEWVQRQKEVIFEKPFQFLEIPAKHFWDGEYHNEHFPGITVSDPRPNAPKHHILWNGDLGQVGWYIHGYKSMWMPESLLRKAQQSNLVDALFKATRHWSVSFHFNKGLAGAPANEKAAARETAMNPDVLGAFALAIIAGGGSPGYSGISKTSSDLGNAKTDAIRIGKAMSELQKVAPDAGSYVSESDYFNADWRRVFWGSNYLKLSEVKKKYDPEGLFFVHHGVGSEYWSQDGFTRLFQ